MWGMFFNTNARARARAVKEEYGKTLPTFPTFP